MIEGKLKEEVLHGSNTNFTMNYCVYEIPKQNQYKICGFHGSDYEECCLLGRYGMWLL
jgi:hypothetical protein